MKHLDEQKPTPTPPGTPTQVFVRFVRERPEGIEVQIGCDGEEAVPENTRKMMALVARSFSAAFLLVGDMGAVERAERLAEYIENHNTNHKDP